MVYSTKANITIKDEKGENIGRFFCPYAVLSDSVLSGEADNLKPNEKAKKNIPGTILGVEVKKT